MEDRSPKEPPPELRGAIEEEVVLSDRKSKLRLRVPDAPDPSATKERVTTSSGTVDRPLHHSASLFYVGDVKESATIATAIDALGSAEPERAPPSPRTKVKAAIELLSTIGPDEVEPHLRSVLTLDTSLLLHEVERDFPGLCWVHRDTTHQKLPRGVEIGPLGALLVRIGARAIPSVARLMRSPHKDVRYYACLVAADLVRGEETPRALLEGLQERLFDLDPAIQDAALHGLRGVNTQAKAQLGEQLSALTQDRNEETMRRSSALKALGVLRLREGVEVAIAQIERRDARFVTTARQVLRLLCAQDFGENAQRWRRWQRQTRDLSRARWLVEGLMHREEAIRELAAKELTQLLGPLDYDPFAPWLARRRATSRLRAQVA